MMGSDIAKEIIDIDGKNILVINRPDLDNLIEQSRLIRKKLSQTFYQYDSDAILRIQFDKNFILTSTEGLNKKDKTIKFLGITYKNDIPIGANFEMIINDIDHLSCIRFAYSSYNVMQINNKRYSQLLQDKRFRIDTDSGKINDLEDYFKENLEGYLNGTARQA